jgi:hypothetical protein
MLIAATLTADQLTPAIEHIIVISSHTWQRPVTNANSFAFYISRMFIGPV